MVSRCKRGIRRKEGSLLSRTRTCNVTAYPRAAMAGNPSSHRMRLGNSSQGTLPIHAKHTLMVSKRTVFGKGGSKLPCHIRWQEIMVIARSRWRAHIYLIHNNKWSSKYSRLLCLEERAVSRSPQTTHPVSSISGLLRAFMRDLKRPLSDNQQPEGRFFRSHRKPPLPSQPKRWHLFQKKMHRQTTLPRHKGRAREDQEVLLTCSREVV